MKKLISFLLTGFIFLFPLIDIAQNGEPENYSNSITVQELKDHMYYLASDELNGRLTGSKYFDIAADYAITQLKQAGLKPICMDSSGNKNYKQMIYFQKYTVGPNDSMIFEKNGIKKVYLFPGDYVYENLVDPLNEKICGEVVFVGNGLYEKDLNWNDYEGVDIKDKWLVMFFEIEQEYTEGFTDIIEKSGKKLEDILKNRNEFIKNSEAEGVIYILPEKWLNTWDDWAYNFGTKRIITDNTYQHKNDTGIQWISVRVDFLNHMFEGEKYDPINNKGKYQTYELKNLNISLNKEYLISKVKSPNVVAYIEGSDSILKNEFVVLGAHLDHLGVRNGKIMNGADDNASGSIAVLEIAEAVALSKPKRSVAFVLFTEEEGGMIGSKYFVDHCPINTDSIQLYVNLDEIGRSDGKASDVAPIGYDSGPVMMKDILIKLNNELVDLKLDFAFADSSDFLSKSDQYSFYKKGIPVVSFSDGLPDDYHTPLDDVVKIDFNYLRNVSVLTYDLIMEVVNKEENLRIK